MARFRAEARHAAALSHENIAQVYDYGEAVGGSAYLVMELVAGAVSRDGAGRRPAGCHPDRGHRRPDRGGLQAAHAAGMVHRDIKPGNLLITPEGHASRSPISASPHTVDAASVTATGELIGTPAYLAPERATGERAGPPSDLYSLGIVAYECLAGARPFTGTPLEVALAHRDRPAAAAAPVGSP